jgi:hypothetical protein
MIVGAGACGGERASPGDAAAAVFVLPRAEESAFFDLPWPTDLRGTARGTIDVSDFPNPVRSPLIDTYAEALTAEVDGWATSGSVYFRFEAPVDPASLPMDPAASRLEGSTVVLLDVDPDSSERLTRRPVRTRLQREATDFWPENSLAVLPVHGFVLRPRTTYAVVLTTGLRSSPVLPFERDADLEALLFGGGDEAVQRARSTMEPAVAAIEEAGIARDEILSLAVFTTQDATGGLFAAADVVREEVEAPTAREWWQAEAAATHAVAIARWGPVPIFQTGEAPYLDEGGTFELDDAGRPIVQALDETRLAMSIPTGEIPIEGCPTVIYAHGTGGDYLSFTRDGTAANLAARGMCVLGFDQVLHGDRSPDGDTTGTSFFNYLNPLAGRDNARQSAIDVVQQARLATSGLVVPGDAAGRAADVAIDPNKVLFMGHSQGGLNGPLFLAIDGTALGAVFSGAGGGLNISMIEKKEPFEILTVVSLVLDVDPVEEGLDMFHPVATLAQTLAEPADVLNYARHWFEEPVGGRPPRSVLMTEGLLDDYTPPASIEALAIAGGVSLVEPVARGIEGMDLRGLPALGAPVRANAPGGVTGALVQFPEDGHFAVFRNERAKECYGDFLRSVADDGIGVVHE